ncbi:hypothetical protein TNCV_1345531 [Trichonephila clavipes]|nr:hypothetical protein TNCV_1345531 [Trichonephila clavipes]
MRIDPLRTGLTEIDSQGEELPRVKRSGAHYRLFSVWTLVPVRLGKQWSGSTTVDEIASEAADCRLTYTMANCPQRR